MDRNELVKLDKDFDIEKSLRLALLNNKMFSESELALMTCEDVYYNILLRFEVLQSYEKIVLVRKEVYPQYKNLIYTINKIKGK